MSLEVDSEIVVIGAHFTYGNKLHANNVDNMCRICELFNAGIEPTLLLAGHHLVYEVVFLGVAPRILRVNGALDLPQVAMLSFGSEFGWSTALR